jgi:soluble lytic murein transglycosylase-like protein
MTTDLETSWVSRMVKESAEQHGIDAQVFRAICKTESNLDPYAIRFEPAYQWVYKVPEFAKRWHTTDLTERALQCFSYGLAQVMGAVIREYGYIGPLNAIVHQWDLSLDYGAQHFSKQFRKYGHLDDAIAAYNAGSVKRLPNGDYINQAYVKLVHSNMTN